MSGEYEKVDNTPVEIPTRLRLPQSRTDQIRAFIREELSRRADDEGHESFEEADDLDPDDGDNEPYTAYELLELEPPSPSLQNRQEAEGQQPDDPAAKSEGKSSEQSTGDANGEKITPSKP